MKILAIDTELTTLELLVAGIRTVYPEVEIQIFLEVKKLLEEAGKADFDVVFCNVVLPEMDGIQLAERLKEIHPTCNIIFVADSDEYAIDAMKVHASGYIKTPVTKESIRYELDDLRYPVKDRSGQKCRLQCYGNFEVFNAEGKVIHFKRRKSKEALAYITHRRGAVCTTREVAAVLFEDAPCDLKQMSYMQKIISGMIKDLQGGGAGDVVIRHYNGLAVDLSKVSCDYYNNPDRRTIYGEDYMMQYSWAEYI